MKFSNDRILKDMNINTFDRFGKEGLIRKINELEARIDALEIKREEIRPKRGRPPKVSNG